MDSGGEEEEEMDIREKRNMASWRTRGARKDEMYKWITEEERGWRSRLNSRESEEKREEEKVWSK